MELAEQLVELAELFIELLAELKAWVKVQYPKELEAWVKI